ncbi:MAG TPA: hypothetical protein VGF84_04990, partial [Micromonosporaceae bacterium]
MLTAVSEGVTVGFAGLEYAAEPVPSGAAYEIFTNVPADGFVPNPRPAAAMPFRRFVHATEVELLGGTAPKPYDAPLCLPLSPTMSMALAHRLSQSMPGASAATDAAARAMRDSIRIRRGTRMVKILSGRQLAGHLHGWLPQGFCHREYDIAHLRTPAGLAILATDRDGVHDAQDVVFALRWRAIDARDYATPYASDFGGLTAMSPHARVGPPVLGTGFAPTSRHIVPEFVTADLTDLALPAHAELIAYTADGTEVLLYRYLAEQRGWGRLAGPQWRGLLAGVDGIAPDQEYFPVPGPPTRIVGSYHGSTYEVVADPRENEFLVLAKVRALRAPVTSAARRTPTVTWRGVRCSVIRDSDGWLRVRLLRPSPDALEQTGAACVERGIYETWVPANEAVDSDDIIVRYDL